MTSEETLATRCYYEIKKLILDGELLPGQRLKGEYLKHVLKVGSSPIREALTRLATTEMVEFRDKAGFSVALITKPKVYDAIKTYAKVEAMLLKESILAGDDSWEADVTAALYRLSKVENKGNFVDYQTWSERNDYFHDTLVSACGLVGLTKIREECSLLKDWYTSLCYKDKRDQIVTTNHSEHAKIAELAISRKVDLACTKLYNHIIYDLDLIVSELERKKFLVS